LIYNTCIKIPKIPLWVSFFAECIYNTYYKKQVIDCCLTLTKKSKFITVQHTSGHVKVSTVYDHHARSTLFCTSSAQTQSNLLHCFLVLFAIPVATFVHVPGNSTAVRYTDEILQPHLMHVIDRQRELF
jgi:hypothetical protein